MSGAIFKRCSCDPADLRSSVTGKRITCRKEHGSWGYNRKIKDAGTGKWKQITRSGFENKSEAQAALVTLNSEINAGTYTDDHGITVARWLDTWLERKVERGIAYSTEKVYRQHIGDYLKPALGAIRLSDLRPGHVDTLLHNLQTAAGKAEKPLTASTITRVHACLRSALTTAVRMRLVSFNAAKDVDLPKQDRKRVHPWQPAELGAFLDHASSHRLGALFQTIAATGLRRGEALGLRWDDVDLKRGVLVVKQQLVEKGGLRYQCDTCDGEHRGIAFTDTKTDAGSWRVVDLDGLTVGTLLEHQMRQAGEQQEWAEAYTDHGLVFARENGTPMQPSAVTDVFHTLTDEVSIDDADGKPVPLRRVRLHDLRHGAASLMLAAGVDMNVISKRLGHSRSSFTADTYAHMLDGVGREAAEKAAALIPRRGAEQAPSADRC